MTRALALASYPFTLFRDDWTELPWTGRGLMVLAIAAGALVGLLGGVSLGIALVSLVPGLG